MHLLPAAKKVGDGRLQLHVELPPFGSTFLVFGVLPLAQESVASGTSRVEPLAAEWQMSFEAGRGAPEQPITVTTLQSWSESSDPGVRFFSGSATYSTTVKAPAFAAGDQVLLHFAEVHEIARIKVNGKDAGTVWAQPLTLRVDPWLTQGENKIEIEVTNLWPNRIIGDLQPDAATHFTSTNITAYRANSPLLPSGLIGPVEWIVRK
jgi:hypothetical protein